MLIDNGLDRSSPVQKNETWCKSYCYETRDFPGGFWNIDWLKLKRIPGTYKLSGIWKRYEWSFNIFLYAS